MYIYKKQEAADHGGSHGHRASRPPKPWGLRRFKGPETPGFGCLNGYVCIYICVCVVAIVQLASSMAATRPLQSLLGIICRVSFGCRSLELSRRTPCLPRLNTSLTWKSAVPTSKINLFLSFSPCFRFWVHFLLSCLCLVQVLFILLHGLCVCLQF